MKLATITGFMCLILLFHLGCVVNGHAIDDTAINQPDALDRGIFLISFHRFNNIKFLVFQSVVVNTSLAWTWIAVRDSPVKPCNICRFGFLWIPGVNEMVLK